MNINILKDYLNKCKKNGITPTWEGLKIYNIGLQVLGMIKK